MTDLARPFYCRECGSPMINAPSGSCCPKGHGRLQPRMPIAAERNNVARLLGVLEVRSRFEFGIPGRDGKFTAKRRYAKGATSIGNDIDRLVLADGNLYWIDEIESR